MTQGRFPRFPYWKDERIMGFVTVRWAVRLFIVVVLAGFVSFGLTGLEVFHLIASNKAAQQRANQMAAYRHAQRLSDQAATNAKIAQVYCAQANVVLRLFPQDQSSKNYAKLIYDTYKCDTGFPTSLPKLTTVPSAPPGSGH